MAHFWRDAPIFIDEISPALLRTSTRATERSNKFPCFVLKMRQALTFLATFENDHRGHENARRHIDPGAAHDLGRGLYRPDTGLRPAHGTAGELTQGRGGRRRGKRGERCFQWIKFSGSSAYRPFFWPCTSPRRFRAADSRNPNGSGAAGLVLPPWQTCQSGGDRLRKYGNVLP
ncbi:hypothetical protein ES703_32609 [subsurface metagenome]